MQAYIAITDGDWYRFLRQQEPDEVNFWTPSGKPPVSRLNPGEPFLFKLHSPDNFIVGGGFFQAFSAWPLTIVWDFFGEKNGASTLAEMRERIEKYREAPLGRHEDPSVGCVLLASPFFFAREEWIEIPKDFSLNIQRGKIYDTTRGEGLRVWREVQDRLQGSIVFEGDVDQPSLYGEKILFAPRLGQGTFRALVTDLYDRNCAVTGEKALPVLDAAHIKPVSEGGRHQLQNGLLLRTDLHRLYDRGYVTVTPDYRFRVSKMLKAEFDNGEPYYPLAGREIRLPQDEAARPSRDFLEWHADTVFRG